MNGQRDRRKGERKPEVEDYRTGNEER